MAAFTVIGGLAGVQAAPVPPSIPVDQPTIPNNSENQYALPDARGIGGTVYGNRAGFFCALPAIYANSNFRGDSAMQDHLRAGWDGFYRRYEWNRVAPSSEQRVWADMDADIQWAADNGLTMDVFIPFKSFDGVNYAPSDLVQYSSLTQGDSPDGYSMFLWKAEVWQPYRDLLVDIHTRYANHPGFNGLKLPETALGLRQYTSPVDGDDNPIPAREGYTAIGMRDVWAQLVRDCHAAAGQGKRTSWYTNYIDSQRFNEDSDEMIDSVVDIMIAENLYSIALGGPDILQQNGTLSSLSYPTYRKYKGVPKVGGFQFDSGREANPDAPGSNYTPMQQCEFARDFLGCRQIDVNYGLTAPAGQYRSIHVLDQVVNNPDWHWHYWPLVAPDRDAFDTLQARSLELFEGQTRLFIPGDNPNNISGTYQRQPGRSYFKGEVVNQALEMWFATNEQTGATDAGAFSFPLPNALTCRHESAYSNWLIITSPGGVSGIQEGDPLCFGFCEGYRPTVLEIDAPNNRIRIPYRAFAPETDTTAGNTGRPIANSAAEVPIWHMPAAQAVQPDGNVTWQWSGNLQGLMNSYPGDPGGGTAWESQIGRFYGDTAPLPNRYGKYYMDSFEGDDSRSVNYYQPTAGMWEMRERDRRLGGRLLTDNQRSMLWNGVHQINGCMTNVPAPEKSPGYYNQIDWLLTQMMMGDSRPGGTVITPQFLSNWIRDRMEFEAAADWTSTVARNGLNHPTEPNYQREIGLRICVQTVHNTYGDGTPYLWNIDGETDDPLYWLMNWGVEQLWKMDQQASAPNRESQPFYIGMALCFGLSRAITDEIAAGRDPERFFRSAAQGIGTYTLTHPWGSFSEAIVQIAYRMANTWIAQDGNPYFFSDATDRNDAEAWQAASEHSFYINSLNDAVPALVGKGHDTLNGVASPTYWAAAGELMSGRAQPPAQDPSWDGFKMLNFGRRLVEVGAENGSWSGLADSDGASDAWTHMTKQGAQNGFYCNLYRRKYYELTGADL